MALTKFTEDTAVHQSLLNQPTQTAEELKVLFDKSATDLKTYINNTLTAEVDSGLALKSSDLNTHKTSSDHDGRYYTETESDALLAQKTNLTGNHQGTWQGFEPSQVDQTIRDTVNTHSQQIADITTQLEDISYMSVNVKDFGVIGDGVADDTVALQSAIDYCILNNRDLIIPTLCRITAPLTIDRQVDGAAFDSYFNIISYSGGGIYVDADIVGMFSTTTPYTSNPVSQLVRWDNLRFVASNNSLNAYVLHGSRFLRSEFSNCSFSKIKCINALTYVQSIYFKNCNARRWSGTFFKSLEQGYDIQIIGGLYESGSGDCFDIKSPIGSKVWATIEGVSGTALKINGAQGIDISSYFEQNGIDIDSRTGGLFNYGINIHGSYFSHQQNSAYSVVWGSCTGCTSHGNWHTNNMHDLQLDSIVDINDVAQTNLSNISIARSHAGYREHSALPTMTIRGSESESYTFSMTNSIASVVGNRVSIEFVGTLTSTGTNPEDKIYIPSLFPYDAENNSMMCGHIELVGSSVNNGISPLFITNASPMRVQSCINIIPSNTSGNSWTLRGQISYMKVS